MKKLIYVSAAAGILAFGGIVLADSENTAPAVQKFQDAASSNNGTGNLNRGAAPESKTAQVAPIERQSTGNGQQLIGKQQAIEAAKSAAPGKIDDVELEKEDGWAYYEVELEDGKTDYDVIVDAADGTVVSVESDDDNHNDDNDHDDYDNDDD
ncbi:PepSY domain-containing protein [Planococcus maitriensis]|uniref:PepSY domain-containing protein n=1 Tax=Planococcus maitriensis TaxID=221799 RepID=UPI00142D9877|nr:PepSY domain-containing protein [Planococcus maitriensis]